MKKTLQRILGIGIILCGLSSGLKEPCYATPVHPEYLREPAVAAQKDERVEPGYSNRDKVSTIAITAIALGLIGLGSGMIYGRRKIN